ncbi:hypothetical protein BAUCODRAFT_160504 [Baudoinia panamericana UAMH 10762]|uniref:Uncharacterized protein n=1 Tax=Baudoinia panamericana (strain UAMH 10762) TaxID=717646 RepID=M2M5G0_BAUPA|nr:uncharacterized protein BAUCODRAFT_160504 [Baudoinia panamericana UAMH 10762]EMC91861.1 hypothetical protein BAUCODRAFT_160504 [Baudoinia panamericana UAMH 10762]
MAAQTSERYRVLINQNAAHSQGFRRKPQLITYRRNSRPLPLTGSQFARKDPYDIPSSDDEIGAEEANQQAQRAVSKREDPSSDSSALSDAELVSTGQSGAQYTDRPSRQEFSYAAAAGGRLKAAVGSARVQKAVTGVTQGSKAKSTHTGKAPRRPVAIIKSARNAVEVARSKAASKVHLRRLPVSELVCVSSLPDTAAMPEPVSSAPAIHVQDPIVDSVSQGQGHQARRFRSKQQLSAPALKQKFLRPQRRGHSFTLPFLANTTNGRQGDGFEDTERLVSYRPKQKRKRKCTAALTFAALSISGGPLPEVHFDPALSDVKLEVSSAPMPYANLNDEADPGILAKGSDGLGSQRKVSLNGRTELIMAQLSSVKAPERQYSDSEASDEDDASENDDMEPDAVQAANEDQMNEGMTEEHEPPEQTLSPRQGTEAQLRGAMEDVEDVVDMQSDGGVTWDFRRSRMPGAYPKSSQSRKDVNKADSDVSFEFRRHPMPGTYPRSSHAMIEVNEVIEEVVDPTVRMSNHAGFGRNQLLGYDATKTLTEGARPRRLRSVLKKGSQTGPDSSCKAEDTAANTRRNSTIRVEDSHYFTTATDMLRVPDPVKHIIVPRRRPSYLDDANVQVPNSEGDVPETSQMPPDYTYQSQLKALREHMAGMAMPDPAIDAPRDLRTLIRSVSRGNGTLSQSVRRRPSLPFQSPTKVR